MSALAPRTFAATTLRDLYTAWRQRDGNKAQRVPCDGSDLAEVLQSAFASCQHKDVVFLLHTDRLSGRKVLHCYLIRMGKREWRVDPETGIPGWIALARPDCLFSMPVIDFAPDELWRWTPGADVVGIGHSIVEPQA